MPQNLIQLYKSSGRLSFSSPELEEKFHKVMAARGRTNSVYAFVILAVMCFSFASIEYFGLAIDNMLPMQLFIAVGLIAIVNGLVSFFKRPAPLTTIRLMTNLFLALGVILYTVISVKYRLYYVLEVIFLMIWVALFSFDRLRLSFFTNLLIVAAFVGVMQWMGESSLKIILVTCFLFTAAIFGVLIAYLWERMRRMLFMSNEVIDDISSRQEVWAYTLIDLDMALSGITDFKKILSRMLEYLGTVINFDSSIITSLEGQGPKPKPLKVHGELFENEDKTIWNESLMSKLEQTRQAYNSDFYVEHKGFLGKTIKEFKHFRLDIPVFNEFNLVGIISLRRESKAFDDLDMTASVSLVTQSMMIFNRSQHTQNITPSSIHQETDKHLQTLEFSVENTDISTPSEPQEGQKKFLQSSPNVNVAPKNLQDEFKKKGDDAKKSLVILSRENADKISVDRYRSAAIDGEPLSFIIMEIDALSSIREKDGDKVAYRVFSGIAKQLFAKLAKGKHVVGRYGKNGISVLMPGVDMNAAEKFSEVFRQFVEQEKYKTVYGTRTATLSIGIAAITDDTGDYASMMKRADMALFVAKKNGRNCVKVRL